ncbi:MAG TPA: LEA type 2 family protein [Gemmatimonadaceae bacterium]|nr:LEA type 2 family protein [Gemmatimonadaceae bacterium]
MRKLVLLATTVTAVAGVGCRTFGGAFAEPVVTFKNVSVKGVGLEGGSVDIVLSVYNPNGYRLDATKMTYRLLVDSVEVGSGATDSKFTVQSNDSTEVRLPLDFRWAGMSQAGRQILNQGTVPYRVMGEISVGSGFGSFTVPYDRTGRFSALGTTR